MTQLGLKFNDITTYPTAQEHCCFTELSRLVMISK